jgi:hypothetical protein
MDKERVAAARQQTDPEWHEALNRHPDLKARMMRLLALVDSADVALADEAERRAIRELRGMGQEVLNAWAQSQAGRACSQMPAAEAFKDGKKKSSGTAPTASSKSKSPVSGCGDGAR